MTISDFIASKKRLKRDHSELNQVHPAGLPLVIAPRQDDVNSVISNRSNNTSLFSVAARSNGSTILNDITTLFFGPSHNINRQEEPSFIEYQQILTIQNIQDAPDLATLVQTIDSSPTQSILLSSPYSKVGNKIEHWKRKDAEHKGIKELKAKDVVTLMAEEEQIRVSKLEYKKTLDEVQKNYDDLDKAWMAKRHMRCELEGEVKGHHRREIQYNLLHGAASHFENDSGWANKDDSFAREKLLLTTDDHVAELNKAGCQRILNVLVGKKYYGSESFTTLWNMPPNGYTMEEWTDMYGSKPQIYCANTTLRNLRTRICDYLRLRNDKIGLATQPRQHDSLSVIPEDEAELQRFESAWKAKNRQMEALIAARKASNRLEKEQAEANRKVKELEEAMKE